MYTTIWRIAALSAFACVALPGTAALGQNGLKIEVLSSLPTMVTGGDALVKITGTEAAPKVMVAGRDVSAGFKRHPKGGWVGLVDGLKDGNNELSAGDGKGIAEIMPACEVSLASFTPPAAQGTARGAGSAAW